MPAKKQSPPPDPAPETIELLGSITHDGLEYSSGIYQTTDADAENYLSPELAQRFLAMHVPNRTQGPQPVAQIPRPPEEPAKGAVRPAADADKSKKD